MMLFIEKTYGFGVILLITTQRINIMMKNMAGTI